jgi:hypothetical protein
MITGIAITFQFIGGAFLGLSLGDSRKHLVIGLIGFFIIMLGVLTIKYNEHQMFLKRALEIEYATIDNGKITFNKDLKYIINNEKE